MKVLYSPDPLTFLLCLTRKNTLTHTCPASRLPCHRQGRSTSPPGPASHAKCPAEKAVGRALGGAAPLAAAAEGRAIASTGCRRERFVWVRFCRCGRSCSQRLSRCGSGAGGAAFLLSNDCTQTPPTYTLATTNAHHVPFMGGGSWIKRYMHGKPASLIVHGDHAILATRAWYHSHILRYHRYMYIM